MHVLLPDYDTAGRLKLRFAKHIKFDFFQNGVRVSVLPTSSGFVKKLNSSIGLRDFITPLLQLQTF